MGSRRPRPGLLGPVRNGCPMLPGFSLTRPVLGHPRALVPAGCAAAEGLWARLPVLPPGLVSGSPQGPTRRAWAGHPAGGVDLRSRLLQCCQAGAALGLMEESPNLGGLRIHPRGLDVRVV
jgi:hypothetical protein